MVGHIIRLISAYISKNRRQFILGFLLGVFGVMAFIFILPKFNNRRPINTIGIADNVTIANLPLDVQQKISFGLTKINPDGTASPAAAISYTATDSGKTFIFKLRPDLYWQDGKKFTAADINYKLANVNITALDGETVKFSLEGPFSPLPVIVSQPLFKPGLIGLGEYRVKSLKSNGRFLQSLSLIKGNEEFIYKFYPTESTLNTAFKLGEIRKIITTNVNGLGKYKRGESPDYNRQVIAFFNNKNGPTAEKVFRQALLYSLPQLSNAGMVSSGPIPPVNWSFNPQVKKYNGNLDLAKKMLAKTSATQSAALKISANMNLKQISEDLKKSWEAAGLIITLETADNAPGNYDVYLTTVEIPVDPDQYQLWHSTSFLNISGYKSPKSDKLLEEGRQALDQSTRKQIYDDWQKAITEDAPAAFLYFPYIYTVSRDN